MTAAEHKRQREGVDTLLGVFDRLVGGGPGPVTAPGLRRRVLYELASYVGGDARDMSRLRAAMQDLEDWLSDELIEAQKRAAR